MMLNDLKLAQAGRKNGRREGADRGRDRGII